MVRAIILFYFISAVTFAQDIRSDYLEIWRDHSLHDTVRLAALSDLAWELHDVEPENAIQYAELEFKEAQKIGDKLFMADAMTMIGSSHMAMGENELAINAFEEALAIGQTTNPPKEYPAVINNMSLIYSDLGNHTKAMELATKALNIHEKEKDTMAYCIALENIGHIYRAMLNDQMAMSCFRKTLSLSLLIGDLEGVSIGLANIGEIHHNMGNYDSALYYSYESIKTDRQIGNYIGLATSFSSIAHTYLEIEEYELAKSNFDSSLYYAEKIGDKNTISDSYEGLALYYLQKGNLDAALRYGNDALQIGQEIGTLDHISGPSHTLYEIYKAKADYENALSMFIIYTTIMDSIKNLDYQQSVMAIEVGNEYEQKAIQDSIINAEKNKVKDAEILAKNAQINQEKIQRYAMFGGLILVIALAVFVYNRLKITSRQKQVIEAQKNEVEAQKILVEEKNKEITDSINYAKRIQAAILPTDKKFIEALAESFILYRPKDIVAGDFYWLEKTEDVVLFAAADCTGHGVPGAMVSVICNNGLNRSVREHKLSDPADVLNKTREIVIQEFEKSEEEVRDGMDISLCSLNLKTRVVKWSGANNPLWILRNDASEIEEIKAQKQPIGKFLSPEPFISRQLQLSLGDQLFLFTDGFQDQFGGEKAKKYKASNLKKLILQIRDLKPKDQKKSLEVALDAWRGGLEQVDDICLIGVKL